MSVVQTKVRWSVRADEDDLAELLDRENGNGETFEFELIPDSEFVQAHQTPDTRIAIQKSLNNGRLTLRADIRVPKIVKDTEIIPWKDDPEVFLRREVEKPYKIKNEKKGYEIPFTQHFYVYKPLRSPDEVLGKFQALEEENARLKKEIFG